MKPCCIEEKGVIALRSELGMYMCDFLKKSCTFCERTCQAKNQECVKEGHEIFVNYFAFKNPNNACSHSGSLHFSQT